jgi:hypothetical protein
MIKFAMLSLVVLLSASMSFAQSNNPPRRKKAPMADQVGGQGYGTAGCGLGSIVFGDKPGLVQVLAATTNGTSWTQTFGISSGTSNCDENADGSPRTAALFITANREAVEKDIARGSGETVVSLSQIMGCKDSAAYGRNLQSQYATIFPSAQVSTDVVVDKIMNAGCGQNG